MTDEKTVSLSKKQRDSNFELFRIISMLLIVAHHYVVNSGLMTDMLAKPLQGNSIGLFILGAWGKTGINCFVLITGYFMCQSKITATKFLKLLFEVEFYKIVIYAIFVLSGYADFSLSSLANAVLPFSKVGQNFTGCFLIFYLLIPFLNVLVHNMTEKQHVKLLLLLSCVYIVLGTLLGSNVTMNYVTWFVVLYIIASYVGTYPKKLFKNTVFWGWTALASVLLSLASIIILNYTQAKYQFFSPYSFMTDSNKLFAFMTGFSSFMFFKNIKMRPSKIINTVATSTFGVLLIHSNSDVMRKWVWIDIVNPRAMFDSKYLFVHAAVSILGIFVVCTVIDYFRILLIEKPFFKLWDRHWEKIVVFYKKIENKLCDRFNIQE